MSCKMEGLRHEEKEPIEELREMKVIEERETRGRERQRSEEREEEEGGGSFLLTCIAL